MFYKQSEKNLIFKELVKKTEDISELEKSCLKLDEKSTFFIHFPNEVDKAYRKLSFHADKQKNILFFLIGLFFYDAFIFMDKLMIYDVHELAMKLRFFFVTPVAVLCLALIYYAKKPVTMDIAVNTCLLTSCAAIFMMVNSSSSEMAPQYHSGLFLISLAGLLVMKTSFKSKILLSFLLMVLHLFFFQFNTNIAYYSKINIFSVLMTTIFISLISIAEIEFRTRKDFIAALLQEITTETLLEKNKFLKVLSNMDELTGLANRRFFDMHLKRLVSNIGNGIFPIAVLYMDLDNFKNYNDTYGHLKGDNALKRVASVLKFSTNRKFDLCARFGGEEFLIILPFTSQNEAFVVAEKIRTSIQDLKIENKIDGSHGHLTLSIGISFLKDNETDVQTIIDEADQALYHAKNSGRNRVVLFKNI